LACCHDNGYVAELDKYRHDAIASPKTILVHAAQAAKQYSSLQFPVTRFNTVFEEYIPQITKVQTIRRDRSPSIADIQPVDDAASQASNEAIVSAAPPTTQTWSAMASSIQKPSAKIPVRPMLSPKDEKVEPKGIAVNRFDQRIDLALRPPTQAELAAFDARIAKRKLCNKYHLSKNCNTGGKQCAYDHDAISGSMLNTLKLKARSIPCAHGQKCRQADCIHGHQCPWGKSGCNNPKCLFHKVNMHNIHDSEIARLVPAES
jgi:hypothetical protein